MKPSLKIGFFLALCLIIYGCDKQLSNESNQNSGGETPQISQGGSTRGLPYPEELAYGVGLPAGELPPGDKNGFTSAWEAENAGKHNNCTGRCQIKTQMILQPGG